MKPTAGLKSSPTLSTRTEFDQSRVWYATRPLKAASLPAPSVFDIDAHASAVQSCPMPSRPSAAKTELEDTLGPLELDLSTAISPTRDLAESSFTTRRTPKVL